MTKQKGRFFFNEFYSTDINTNIETVSIAHKGTKIVLKDNREFIFYPITNEQLNNSSIFNYTAEKGDKIVKPSYSDTLVLIKDNKFLKYTFIKFEK